ncbi:CvpA family protein [Staphylococcus taiwanensis]|nr:CvpA family protein [Staphylococcus taiwanensis]
MIIDFIILFIMFYYLIIGFRRGAWLNSLHLLASVVALIVAHHFYRALSKQLVVFLPYPKTVAFDTQFAFHFNDLQQRFDTIIAFITIAIVSKLLLYLIIVTFDNIVTYQNIKRLSRIFGCMLSIIMAVIVIQLLLYVLSIYPVDWIQTSLKHSYLGSVILFNTPFFSSYILNL